LSSADVFQIKEKGRSPDADVHTFWCKKSSYLSKFIVCPHGQEGWGLKSADKEGGNGVARGQVGARTLGRSAGLGGASYFLQSFKNAYKQKFRSKYVLKMRIFRK